MKTIRKSFLYSALAIIMLSGNSCSVWRKVFPTKYGCPANGRSFGAERILSGEKMPKQKNSRHSIAGK